MEPLPFRKSLRVTPSRPASREGLFVLASAWRRSASVRPFPQPVDRVKDTRGAVEVTAPSSPDDGPAAA
jgi:hypothetical protein